ncbi:hypothetical protein BH20ACT14_BH20ACT14_16690 [soil metagenome]
MDLDGGSYVVTGFDRADFEDLTPAILCRIIAENFVTATSGTGTRGTFEFTVPFMVDFDGVGELIVFEASAKDGSRINLVEIPLRMKQ